MTQSPEQAKSVYKYELNVGTTSHNMPMDARFLRAGNQREKIVLWFEVNPHSKWIEYRVFETAVTGGPVPAHGKYLDTVMLAEGGFVAHIYEIKPE